MTLLSTQTSALYFSEGCQTLALFLKNARRLLDILTSVETLLSNSDDEASI